KDGATTKGLLKPARNGYLYWLKRNPDGGISYINAEAYVPQNVFKSIDPKTGRPEIDMAHKPATGKAAQFCPGLWGGKDWPYDAKTGEQLWHFKTNSGIIAPPSTYEVNGVQYVAVQSGYGVDAAFQQGLMSELVGWQKDVPQGGVVWVFAVSK